MYLIHFTFINLSNSAYLTLTSDIEINIVIVSSCTLRKSRNPTHRRDFIRLGGMGRWVDAG